MVSLQAESVVSFLQLQEVSWLIVVIAVAVEVVPEAEVVVVAAAAVPFSK